MALEMVDVTVPSPHRLGYDGTGKALRVHARAKRLRDVKRIHSADLRKLGVVSVILVPEDVAAEVANGEFVVLRGEGALEVIDRRPSTAVGHDGSAVEGVQLIARDAQDKLTFHQEQAERNRRNADLARRSARADFEHDIAASRIGSDLAKRIGDATLELPRDDRQRIADAIDALPEGELGRRLLALAESTERAAAA